MIVFDLDDCLRDTSCADNLIPSDRSNIKNWKPWTDCALREGTPIKPVAYLYQTMIESGLRVMIVTSSMLGTRTWLRNNGLRHDIEVIQREPTDHRHPHDYKREFIDNNSMIIDLWIDDDNIICDYVESLGIPVCRVSFLNSRIIT